MDAMTTDPPSERTPSAVLDQLTGPARGTSLWVGGSALDVSLEPGRGLRIREPRGEDPSGPVIARLHAFEDTYEIETREPYNLWVNGKRVSARKLKQGDLIEFSETGPLCRLRLHPEQAPLEKSVGGLIGDCIDYLRVSRKPVGARTGRAIRDLLWGLTRSTTLFFRLSVVMTLVALAALTVHQLQSNARLQRMVAKDTVRLEMFASALTRARREALSRADLNQLRESLGQSLSRSLGRGLSSAAERLAALEERSGASARVIAAATPAIVFLQGAYGFRDSQTNRPLRHAVDDSGTVLLTPLGQPLLTLEGDGPVAERQFTGTAFVVSDPAVLVTNRHVAVPWEDDANLADLGEQGLEPVWIKFIAYLPDTPEPAPVTLIKASDDADLAVLRFRAAEVSVPRLTLSGTPPKPGDGVIVMGYPTGLKAMLARTGSAFIDRLQSSGTVDFWAVAARLSEQRYIRPLASRGIVGQVTAAAVVYDAETGYGGSGGPVLDLGGSVIGVNTAIIPEYGGSNMGIPADQVRKFLADAPGLLRIPVR